MLQFVFSFLCVLMTLVFSASLSLWLCGCVCVCVCGCVCVCVAVAAKRGRGGGDVDGKAKAKRNLAELFRPPHELLFSGSFEEVSEDDVVGDQSSVQQLHGWMLSLVSLLPSSLPPTPSPSSLYSSLPLPFSLSLAPSLPPSPSLHCVLVQAKQAGCHKRCWLLVNLQDSREFSCQILNRDLWSSPAVRELVQSHFVFIQVSGFLMGKGLCRKLGYISLSLSPFTSNFSLRNCVCVCVCACVRVCVCVCVCVCV